MSTTGLAFTTWSANCFSRLSPVKLGRAPGKALPDQPGKNQPDTLPTQRQPSAINCCSCKHPVTHENFRIEMDGQHGHRVTNPNGIEFIILCFSHANGCLSAGQPYRRHSWFVGYQWQISLCRQCGVHLGWVFSQANQPPFFTLIIDRITD